jgi:hypothetical protein
MKYFFMALACAALLVGCATETETTIDPTTAGSMGASGSGSVALPTDTDNSSPTNSQGIARNPIDGSPTP